MRLSAAIVCVILSASTTARAESCLDISQNKRLQFTGALSFHIFPGPPGFEDVSRGDTPEPGYILTLPYRMCLTGDEFADPSKQFSDIQLLPGAAEQELRRRVGGQATVVVSDPFPAMTGHHHAPMLATVESVVSVSDPTAEYGTAATAVRGFYLALAAGSGEEAAQFIAPEMRRGSFDPAAMSRYYGGLPEPLRLVSIEPRGADSFFARYTMGARRECRALVTTTRREGRDFISHIQALDGC